MMGGFLNLKVCDEKWSGQGILNVSNYNRQYWLLPSKKEKYYLENTELSGYDLNPIIPVDIRFNFLFGKCKNISNEHDWNEPVIGQLMENCVLFHFDFTKFLGPYWRFHLMTNINENGHWQILDDLWAFKYSFNFQNSSDFAPLHELKRGFKPTKHSRFRALQKKKNRTKKENHIEPVIFFSGYFPWPVQFGSEKL